MPFLTQLEHAIEQHARHVELGLQLGAAYHGTVARHDPRLRIGELQEFLLRIGAPAQPSAAEPVQHGILQWRDGIARGQHIRVTEEDIDVAVGVGLDQVAVLDLLSDRRRSRRGRK